MMLRVSSNQCLSFYEICVFKKILSAASSNPTSAKLIRSKSVSNLTTANQNARTQTATLTRAPSTTLKPPTSSTLNRIGMFYLFCQ